VLTAACLIVSWPADAAMAAGWGSGTRDPFQWTPEDRERVEKARQKRLSDQADTYQKAFDAVRLEEQRALKALAKAEAKAEADARGDQVKRDRAQRLARHKTIADLKQVDFKYGRLYTAVDALRNEADLPDDTRSKVEALLVQVRDRARGNREKMADLYEQVEEPIKALHILEAIYKSMPIEERDTASALKTRIKGLKDQLGIRPDADGM
jgi:hypothetical protein